MNPFLLKTAKTTSMSGGDGTAMLQTLLYELKDGAGYVFALYYIEGRPNGAREQIAVIINDHIDRFRQTTTTGMNIARRFEHMLQAINEELSVLGKDFQRIPLAQLHCVFGVITSNQLYLSGIGDLIVQYMHRTNKSRYTIYDLHKQFEPAESTSWDKIFVTVLDGELHPEDVFYLAIPLPTREISESEIQDILATLPPGGALKRIEQYAGSQQPYAGICVRVEAQEIDNTGKKVNPISSLEQFNLTKDETANILGDSQSDIVGSLQKALNPMISKLHRPGDRSVAAIFQQLLRLGLKLFLTLAQFIVFIVKAVAPYVRRAWATITSDKTKAGLRQGAERLGSMAHSARNASRRAYVMFGVGIVVLALLALGIRGIIRGGVKQEQVAQIQEVSSIVTEKRDQASARLIFNDRQGAQLLLTEAISLLDSLPEVRSEAERLAALRGTVTEILNKTRGVITPEIATLAQTPSETRKSVRSGEAIYTFDAAGIVYRFNSVTSTFDTVANQQSGIGPANDIVAADGSVYVIDANRQLGRVNESGSNISAVTSGLNRLADISTAALYNDTLYAMTPSVQQLFRFRAQGESFDGGTAWIISKDADLSGVRDMIIDGDIYLLGSNNLWRFTSGRQTAFTLATVEPNLQNATAVDTQFGGKYIYVLEPSEKRILVYDKEGAFMSQYIHESFANAHSVMIDETQKVGYVMNGQSLLSFPLTHMLQ